MTSAAGRRERNVRAFASVVVGLLAVATLPGAVALARTAAELDLLDAAIAIPVALLLAVLTLVLARRGRQRVERTLGRARGRRMATLGKWLGLLALGLALSGAIAVVTYGVLMRLE